MTHLLVQLLVSCLGIDFVGMLGLQLFVVLLDPSEEVSMVVLFNLNLRLSYFLLLLLVFFLEFHFFVKVL